MNTFNLTINPISANEFTRLRTLLTAIFILILSACGGGGGGDGGTTTPPPVQITTYTIGGNVAGLSGSGLLLRNNGTDDQSIAGDGGFTFATRVNSGSNYDVTVATSPDNPAQTCTVTNGSGTANSNVTNVSVNCVTPVSDIDTDGDRLKDSRELELGTSIEDRDTDGDGLEDGEEVIDLAFDPSNNNFLFNPLIGDIPKVTIAMTSLPDIKISYGASESSATTDSVNYTQGFSNSQTHTSSYSNSTSVEQTHSGGISLTDLGYSYSHASTEEETFGWERTQTSENHEAWEQGVENTSQSGINYTSGNLSVTIQITNSGNQTVEIDLQDMTLSAVQTDPQDHSRFKHIANLGYVTQNGQNPTITVTPGSSTPVPLGFSSEIDLGTALSLLKDSTNLIVRPATWNFVDDQGRAFAHNATYYNAKDAMIVIDYGPNIRRDFDRSIDSHLVATTGSPERDGVSAAEALSEILKIPFETGTVPWDFDGDGVAEGLTENGITAVREAVSDHSTNSYWMVLHEFNDAVNDQVVRTLYNPTQGDAIDFDSLLLKAGNVLHLVFVEDRDNDGIAAREEFQYGLLDEANNPDSSDTDGDGLSDFTELRESWTVNVISESDPDREPYTVYSSPAHADLDNDNVPDADEMQRGLDPAHADTDEDGMNDDDDMVNIGSSAIVEDLYIEMKDSTTVSVDGFIAAAAPQIISVAQIDWGDGSQPFQVEGAQTVFVPNQEHTYPNAADGVDDEFMLTLYVEDDASPPNTLIKTARVVFTESRRFENSMGYNVGYRIDEHIRTAADLDGDGYQELVAFANQVVHVLPGSVNGFVDPPINWSDEWGADDGFPNVDSDPRWLVDINGDDLLDIVGVQSSSSSVFYSLNNGSSFDPSVLWIADIGWDPVKDHAFLANTGNSALPDFVHAQSSNDEIRTYLIQNASLDVSAPIVSILENADFPHEEDIARRRPMFLMDLDNDQCADMVFFGHLATYSMHSQCDGSFGPLTEIVEDFNDGNWNAHPGNRLVSDVDDDGYPDIVAFGYNNVSIVRNLGTQGTISFSDTIDTMHTSFDVSEGWEVNGNNTFVNRNPRYLADSDNDGDQDIVGFHTSQGACIGLNRLAETGQFSQDNGVNCVGPDFAANGAEWSALSGGIREYFPRLTSDIDGDGRSDFIGFSFKDVVYQYAPVVEQFTD